MMSAILNSAILDSDTAILDSDTLLSSLRFTQKHSHSTLTLTQTNSIWLKLIHSHSTWWCKPSWILPSWIQPFWTIKNFTYSLSLNLMMAAIFNSTILDSAILHKKTSLIDCHPTWWWQPSWILAMLDSATAILDSDTLLSSLRFTQKHSHSTLNLIQTNSIWLKLIHSHSTWWWQPSWLLPSWIWLPSWIQPFCTKITSLIHSDSTWWWQPSWILAMLDSATAILDSDTLLSSLRFTQKHSHSTLSLTQTNSIWLKLIHSHSTWWWQPSWILPSWILPSSIQTFWTKKTSLIHFHSTWWWQPSSILPPWIQPFCTK